MFQTKIDIETLYTVISLLLEVSLAFPMFFYRLSFNIVSMSSLNIEL